MVIGVKMVNYTAIETTGVASLAHEPMTLYIILVGIFIVAFLVGAYFYLFGN